MTKKDKLVERIKNNPKNIDFEELHQYLVQHGATWREGGRKSHRYYSLHGNHLSVPRNKPIKPTYVLQAIELVEGKGE